MGLGPDVCIRAASATRTKLPSLHREANNVEMNGREIKHCVLCHRNGEGEEVFSSHNLKTNDGRTVTCPILRRLVCDICGATGDHAHTRRYCPMNRDGAHSRGASLPELKGRRNAAGNLPARPAPAPTAPPASVVAEIRRLEGRVAELRARYYPSKPQPAYLAVRTFGTPASAQEWGPCRHAGLATTKAVKEGTVWGGDEVGRLLAELRLGTTEFTRN